MKRSRDGANASSQLKRPKVSSREEQSGQSQMMTGDQGLTNKCALAFLKEVKDVFHDKSEKYDEFMEIMKNFKAQRINTRGVRGRVKELFKGHRDLILGFNTFLPRGYKIILPLEEQPPQKKPVEFAEEAIRFMTDIMTRFQVNDSVYKSFLNILNMYRRGTKSFTELNKEVTALFQDHPDLLEEFTLFFSSGVAPNYYYRSSAMHVKKRERNITLLGDRDLIADHPDPELDRCLMKADKDQRRRGAKEEDCKDSDHNGSRELLSHKQKSGCRDEDPGAEPLHDTDIFFGMHPISSACEDISSLKSIFSQVFGYLEKVKEKLQNPEDFQEFLNYLCIYSKEIITRQELQSLVSNLLGKYEYLIEGFDEFLAQCEKNEGFLADVKNKRRIPTPIKAEDRNQDKDDEMKKRDLKCLDLERDKSNATDNKDVSVPKMSLYTSKDKYETNPMAISKLDLSNCEQCTPGYRALPENYPIPQTRCRTELGAEILNDPWVSVPSRSENSSNLRLKNQYEESMFRCEDDRYELDMLLVAVNATAKRVEDLIEKINASIKECFPIRIEEHLTAINFRCIEEIYGDHGLEVVEHLKKNAPLVLPIIFTRLKQKQDEWTRNRADFNKVWAEVYAKNYHKSLDQRSVYFKQQDTKSLSTIEIKEIREKKQKENDVLLAVGAGNRQPVIPHLESVYPDLEIHVDGPKDTKNVVKDKNNSAKSGTAIAKGSHGVGFTIMNPENLNTDTNRNESVLLEESNSCKQWQRYRDNKAEEDNYLDSGCSRHNNETETFGSSTQGQMHINASIPNEIPRAKKQDHSIDRLVNANVSLPSGIAQSNRRTDNASGLTATPPATSGNVFSEGGLDLPSLEATSSKSVSQGDEVADHDPNDILSRTLNVPKHLGRVGGVGFGVTQKPNVSLQQSSPSIANGEVQQIKKGFEDLKKRMVKLEKEVQLMNKEPQAEGLGGLCGRKSCTPTATHKPEIPEASRGKGKTSQRTNVSITTPEKE